MLFNQTPAVAAISLRPDSERGSASVSKSRKSEMGSPAAKTSPQKSVREPKTLNSPKVMFTGVVADNAEKVKHSLIGAFLGAGYSCLFSAGNFD